MKNAVQTPRDSHEQTKRLAVLAMLSAVAYALVCLAHLLPPAIGFLRYDPKDVIVAFGGFFYGPVSALLVGVVSSVLEELTVGSTGWIGAVMNIISTSAFACTAALIYRKKRTMGGAILGLSVGVVAMTTVMLLWNYILTPLYMEGATRADVAKMLIPVFLPFNLLKSSLNAALTLLLYRPVTEGLRRAGLLPKSAAKTPVRKQVALWIGAAVVLALSVGLFFYFHSH